MLEYFIINTQFKGSVFNTRGNKEGKIKIFKILLKTTKDTRICILLLKYTTQ